MNQTLYKAIDSARTRIEAVNISDDELKVIADSVATALETEHGRVWNLHRAVMLTLRNGIKRGSSNQCQNIDRLKESLKELKLTCRNTGVH
jgi:hypothetical protein